jgi:hypothetical protein
MSKDLIKKLLQDATAYSDEAEVTIAGQKVSLGDLRALSADERKTVNDKIAEVNAMREDVVKAGRQAQQAYDAAQKVIADQAATTTAGGSGGADNPWEKEPWLAPVDKRFKEYEKKIEEQNTLLKQLSVIVGNGMSAFSQNRWDDEYKAIDWGKTPRKTRDEMIEYAKTNNLLDRNNLPSISRAFDHITAPDRQKQHDDEILEKGRQRGLAESLAARLPQPNVPGPGISTPIPKIPANGDVIGDLWGDANKDPELRTLIEQLGAVGMA